MISVFLNYSGLATFGFTQTCVNNVHACLKSKQPKVVLGLIIFLPMLSCGI